MFIFVHIRVFDFSFYDKILNLNVLLMLEVFDLNLDFLKKILHDFFGEAIAINYRAGNILFTLKSR